MAGFDGFSSERVSLDGITLHVRRGGTGHPLVLLHGFPQNHRCWAPVVADFARHFDVIVPDLRGYGASDAPADDAAHTRYSKRRMALDMVALLDHYGLERTHLLGHDRGARVSYRFALDHPDRLARLGIIEVLPTADYWAAMDAQLSMAIWHWPFLAQPAPLPETLIGGSPGWFIDTLMTSWTRAGSLAGFAPEALDSYRAQAADTARLTAMCADYRAGATTDRADDEADRATGRRIAAPMHFLWAEGGFPARAGNPRAAWQAWAETVTDSSCASGHFVMEENPEAVLRAFLPHFGTA